MSKTQLVKNKNKLTGTRLILAWLVSLIVFLMMLSSVYNLFVKHKKIQTHIKDLKQEEITLKNKKEKLIDNNNYIETNEGQEQIFRDKYRMVKPGEGLIIITKEEYKSTENKKPVLRRFWDTIKRGLGIE